MLSRLPFLLVSLLAAVFAQSGRAEEIPWSLKVEEAVAEAQGSGRPLMFWVLGRSASRDDDIERDQKNAFRNPLVVALASRFVPVKLSRSRYRDQLKAWGLSPWANLEVVFSTPAGTRIDTLSPLGAADAETLARKMALVFRHYRRQLFDEQIKPKLEDPEATEEDLRRALDVITDLLILSADTDVVALVDRESLTSALRTKAYETLAALSTPAAVDELLKRATAEAQAAAVLAQCTPAAAEQMLPALEGQDAALQLIVYHAVTRICRFRDVKPDRFWSGRNLVVKRKEIERVRRVVRRRAERWTERYEEYR